MEMEKLSNDKDRESIFEILDGMMFQLSKTKKMFLIMIITTLIIPPVSLIAITSVYDSPYQDRFKEDFDTRLKSKLDNDEITEDEYDLIHEKFSNRIKPNPLLRPHQLVIFAISIVWLGIGIRQWFVISKWDKRYQQFKEKQKEIDEKFKDDSDDTLTDNGEN
jgi:cell division protein FtsL